MLFTDLCQMCACYREHCLDWLLLTSVRTANECSAVFLVGFMYQYQYHWSRGLRRRSASAHLFGLRVRILLMAWMSVCCACCVFLGIDLCVGLITRPEESYRVWSECDRESSIMRGPWPTGGCRAMRGAGGGDIFVKSTSELCCT